MKKALYVIVSIVFIGLVIGGSWAWRYFSAPIEGKVGVQEKTHEAEYMITAYNHFFDMKASYDKFIVQIQAQEEQLAQVTSDKDKSRILANIAGLKSYQEEVRLQYNADAQKEWTIGQFKDWKLPYQIEK